jgi:hypothetical protein
VLADARYSLSAYMAGGAQHPRTGDRLGVDTCVVSGVLSSGALTRCGRERDHGS